MAVQTGEGTSEIIYGSSSIPAGALTLGGYIARSALSGEWPTILVFGPHPTPTSTIKDICRMLARHGFAAVAPDLTDSHESNARRAMHVAAFVTSKDGGWSNAHYGYGVLAFGPGIHDAAALASNDGRVIAAAAVGATIDDAAAADFAVADIPILFVGSRSDTSVEVDVSIDAQSTLPQTTYVLYGDAESEWWNVDAGGFSTDKADDTFTRVSEFFAEQLPVRV